MQSDNLQISCGIVIRSTAAKNFMMKFVFVSCVSRSCPAKGMKPKVFPLKLRRIWLFAFSAWSSSTCSGFCGNKLALTLTPLLLGQLCIVQEPHAFRRTFKGGSSSLAVRVYTLVLAPCSGEALCKSTFSMGFSGLVKEPAKQSKTVALTQRFQQKLHFALVSKSYSSFARGKTSP